MTTTKCQFPRLLHSRPHRQSCTPPTRCGPTCTPSCYVLKFPTALPIVDIILACDHGTRLGASAFVRLLRLVDCFRLLLQSRDPQFQREALVGGTFWAGPNACLGQPSPNRISRSFLVVRPRHKSAVCQLNKQNVCFRVVYENLGLTSLQAGRSSRLLFQNTALMRHC